MANGIAGNGMRCSTMLGALLELVQLHCISPLFACWQRTSFAIVCKQPGRVYARIDHEAVLHACVSRVLCALRYLRGGMCLYVNILLNQSLSTRHHTHHGHGQLL